MRLPIEIADAFAKAYAQRIAAEISKAKGAGQMVVDLHPTYLRMAALKDAEDAVAAAAAAKAKKAEEAAAKKPEGNPAEAKPAGAAK